MENFFNKLEAIVQTRPASVIACLVLMIFICAMVYWGVKVSFLVLGILLAIVLLAYAFHRAEKN